MAGEQLIFAGATQTSTNNNFPAGTVFDDITFSNGGFTVTGNSVKLNPASGVAIDNVSGQNQINLPLTSDSTGTTIVQAGRLGLGVERSGSRAQRRRGGHPGREHCVGLHWRRSGHDRPQ